MRGVSASWVVTGDETRAPIREGAVVFDAQSQILAVGEAHLLRGAYPAAEWQHQHSVLMPGLVNAHTHLELSALRGRVPGGHGFVPWLRAMLAARAQLQPEQDAEAIDAAVGELLRFGTVAVGEVTNTLASVAALGQAPIIGRIFHEIYAMDRDSGLAKLEAAVASKAQQQAWPDNLGYAMAPHTVFTVHPEILRELVACARRARQQTSLHLAEHPAERAFLEDGGGPFGAFVAQVDAAVPDWEPPAVDPITHAQRCGALGTHVLVVHLTDARPDELIRVARERCPVVLCPRSNLHISVKLPPLLDILAAGLRPALGTDSLASVASLDVLAEARALGERFATVAPRQLIAMATSNGASALNLSDWLGRLEPGLSPGLLAFDFDGEPPRDPEAHVLSSAASARRVLIRAGMPAQGGLS